MLGVNSLAPRCESQEMECDFYQHYFFDGLDTEEDFYKCTAPSEDMWKKFQLVPTPPMSPTRTLSGDGLGDKLSWVSKVLGQDEDCEGHSRSNSHQLFGNLSSIIIQDCMWSGFSASKHLLKVSENLVSAAAPHILPPAPHILPPAPHILPPAPHILPPAPHNPDTASKLVQCSSVNGSPVNTLVTDCVDPEAVLTFPNTRCKKPASSGSESGSDSSDDEEIDVVTVEKQQSRRRLLSGRKPVTITVRADVCPKRFHMSVHRQQHNYAAPSPDSDAEPEEEEPWRKRPCLESSYPQASSPTASSDSPQSSDAEDTDRRRNHNFLERKRRNDLRSRFLALRDQIPGLVESSKTPKVAILTQATEYLLQLRYKERHQAQERKRLRARKQLLLSRIAELKRS